MKASSLMLVFLLCLSLTLIPVSRALAKESPLTDMMIIGAESEEEARSTITIYGGVDPDTTLPTTVRFSFLTSFKLEEIAEVNTETGERLGELRYTAEEDNMSTVYTFTLTKGRGFFAGLFIEDPIFDRSTQMGETAPLASLMISPLDDLKTLTVGFVAPSVDYVGSGTEVVYIGTDEDGKEIYGIPRTDVKAGEMQSFVVAFTSREKRDAALEEKSAEASAAAEAARQQTLAYKLTTPLSLSIIGAVFVLLLAACLLFKQIRQPKVTAGDKE